MQLPSRKNLESTLSHLSQIAGTNITATEIKDLSDKRLVESINTLMEGLNCIPFSDKEKNALIYKQ